MPDFWKETLHGMHMYAHTHNTCMHTQHMHTGKHTHTRTHTNDALYVRWTKRKRERGRERDRDRESYLQCVEVLTPLKGILIQFRYLVIRQISERKKERDRTRGDRERRRERERWGMDRQTLERDRERY